jgi:hypothetical protein
MMDVMAQTAHHMYQGIAVASALATEKAFELGNALP